jgi:lipopolysaccharide/colanic/teichoic acid biosynthesis glycosyltransferase
VNYLLVKRIFDFLFASLLIFLFFPIVITGIIFSSFSTKSFGLYRQSRIGRFGKPFVLYKLKSMVDEAPSSLDKNALSISSSSRLTAVGRFLRATKLDELPQLFNIVLGDMSFIGPRPDVEYYSLHSNPHSSVILSLRPGLSSPASIKYKNEYLALEKSSDPVGYYDSVIWPDKVILNKYYVENVSMLLDLQILCSTVFSLLRL